MVEKSGREPVVMARVENPSKGGIWFEGVAVGDAVGVRKVGGCFLESKAETPSGGQMRGTYQLISFFISFLINLIRVSARGLVGQCERLTSTPTSYLPTQVCDYARGNCAYASRSRIKPGSRVENRISPFVT